MCEACGFMCNYCRQPLATRGRWQRRFALASRCLKEARNALPEARPHDVAESYAVPCCYTSSPHHLCSGGNKVEKDWRRPRLLEKACYLL